MLQRSAQATEPAPHQLHTSRELALEHISLHDVQTELRAVQGSGERDERKP